MQRKELQYKAVQLGLHNRHLLLEWPTGLGKSKVAIDLVREKKDEQWLLVCKETNHIENWRQEFVKHRAEDLWKSSITAICYASLHKYEGQEYNLILDEVHATSELRSDIIKTIKFDRIVSLSATVDYQVQQRLEDICPPHVYKIDISDAIEWGILPEPEINIVTVELGDNDQRKYEKITKDIDYWKSRYNKNFEEWEKIRMLRAGLQRKMFLASIKGKKAKEIIDSLKGKRFICFTGSIEQVEKLGNANIHSKVGKKKREELIHKFNTLEIDELYAVDMLQESMNLNKIDAGIIVQLDNGERTAVQMIGRTLRSLAPEIYILVVKDTQDEIYMRNALSSIDKKYIKHII